MVNRKLSLVYVCPGRSSHLTRAGAEAGDGLTSVWVGGADASGASVAAAVADVVGPERPAPSDGAPLHALASARMTAIAAALTNGLTEREMLAGPGWLRPTRLYTPMSLFANRRVPRASATAATASTPSTEVSWS